MVNEILSQLYHIWRWFFERYFDKYTIFNMTSACQINVIFIQGKRYKVNRKAKLS